MSKEENTSILTEDWVAVVIASAAPAIMPRQIAENEGYTSRGDTVVLNMKPEGDRAVQSDEQFTYEAFV